MTASSSSCTWNTSNSLSWVNISPTSGTGSGSVSITVSANTGGARSGSITIAGQTYTINQDPFISNLDKIVIDTLPQNGDLATAGSLAQGGTFVASGSTLLNFTISVSQGSVATARPIILGTTDNGTPTNGPVLWEGPDVTTPYTHGEITFTPNLPLIVGERYFIGLDYGYLTSVNGSIILLGGRSDNPISDGQAWRAFAGGWDSFSPDVDIAVRIVMDEPALPVQCGAYVAPGVWKEFECYNLAAIGKTTSADPFTPSWELNGGYWQCGRKGPDPEEQDWYNTNTPHFAHGTLGPELSGANEGGVSGWSSSYAPNGAWKDSNGNKTNNDPCPIGYRVPTKDEWDDVLRENDKEYIGSTWTSSATNYETGLKLGDSLFLPAAGYRLYDSGALVLRGYNGYYWSSSEYSSNFAWNLSFVNVGAGMNGYSRLGGLSVRCLAE